MPMYKKRVYKKKPVYKKKGAVKKPSKSLVKTIHNVINKEAETKYINRYNTTQAVLAYDTTTNTYPVFNITPLISQGTGEFNRVANTIHTSKVLFRYRLFMNTAAGITTPLLCRVIIARNKTSLVAPTNWIDLFRGSAGTQAPTNTDIDQFYKINSSNWLVAYDKQHKVGVSSPTGPTNNDFSLSCQATVNLQKHYGKLIYPDTTTTQVTKGWYMFVIPSTYNSSGLLSGAATGVYVSYETQMYFKDV